MAKPGTYHRLQPSGNFFERIAGRITRIAGSAGAFFTALVVVVVWSATGPLFGYSDTWQLIINTSTTIVTFLMVFLIQQSQNKDTVAIQIKLNELIACNEKASNRLIDVEDLSDEEIRMLKEFYVKLSTMSAKNRDLFSTHSLDEAALNHSAKAAFKKKRGQ
ncbi:MAG TPA: low affinity iron permease family protein [Cyclobacteriaceae bacterium]|nr:low affinity iron permease family protein [Cyclobacteriaceae bacterium]